MNISENTISYKFKFKDNIYVYNRIGLNFI